MVTGKGGIGKTLTSAVIAQFAAHAGRKVCIVECRDDDQIPPLFGAPPRGHVEQQIAPGIFSINIDSRENFRDFVAKHLGFETLFDAVFNQSMVSSFVKMLPGVADLTLLGRLFYMSALAPDPYDLVVFDGYASGHFLKFVETPKAVFHSGLMGPVIRETERVLNYFNQPGQTAIVQVASPEPLVLSEVSDFLPKLNGAGCSRVECLVINRFAMDQPSDVPAALQPAFDYLFRHQDALEQKLASVAPSLPIAKLYEMGAIDEPLTTASAYSLIDGAMPA